MHVCNEHVGIVVLYVDDVATIASSKLIRHFIKQALSNEFKIHNLGSLRFMFIQRADVSLTLNHGRYIDKLVENYEVEEKCGICQPILL